MQDMSDYTSKTSIENITDDSQILVEDNKSKLNEISSNQLGSLSEKFKKFLPQQFIPNLTTSHLHLKLQEENQKLWNTFHNPPKNLNTDIQSTTRRVCARLDKTQQITIDCSSYTRTMIGNLKTSEKLVESLLNDYKTLLPFAETRKKDFM